MTNPTKRTPRILAKDFGLAEYKNRRWSAVLEEGFTLVDALKPEFWAHISTQTGFVAGAIIELRNDQHTLYAELYVRDTKPGWAKVALLNAIELETVADLPQSAALQPKWNIGTKSFDVIRTADKQVISSGHKLKEDAVAWIENHNRAMAA